MVCQTSSLVCTRSGLDAAGFSLRETESRLLRPPQGRRTVLSLRRILNNVCALERIPIPAFPSRLGKGPETLAHPPRRQLCKSLHQGRGGFGARRTWSCERCHRGNMQDDPLRGRCDVGACEDVSQWSRCCGMKRALRRNECELEL